MTGTGVDPSEHVFWLASRAAGVVALLLVSLSVGFGLALSGRISRKPGAPAKLRRLHEAIALSSLVAIVAHGGLLLGDAYLRPGIAGIVLPFQMERQPIWTGVGILAGWLAMLVGLSFYARRWITVAVWRWLHRWTLAVYVMALAHTFGSGTDAREPWLLAMVAMTALPIFFLAIFRFLPGGRRKRAAIVSAFHRMRVAQVRRLTADSVLIEFDVPSALLERFRFKSGQHVTVRTRLDGKEVRRTYSVCSPAGSGRLAIAVRRIAGGAFSTFAVERLRAGDELEIMAPTGRFGPALDPRNSNHYVGIAAGSGITPILSILATTLEVEPKSRFTLIYGNRTRASTMFAAELAHLEARHPDRLEVLHVHSRQRQADALLAGRIDGPRVERLLAGRLDADCVAAWFLCGPVAMITDVRTTLVRTGVPRERVHAELFVAPVASGAPTQVSANGASRSHEARTATELTVRLNGVEGNVVLGAGKSILEGALNVRADVPYSCLGGTCGTCRARVIEGAVDMDQSFALEAGELEDGYVLTCQSHAASATLTVDYDA